MARKAYSVVHVINRIGENEQLLFDGYDVLGVVASKSAALQIMVDFITKELDCDGQGIESNEEDDTLTFEVIMPSDDGGLEEYHLINAEPFEPYSNKNYQIDDGVDEDEFMAIKERLLGIFTKDGALSAECCNESAYSGLLERLLKIRTDALNTIETLLNERGVVSIHVTPYAEAEYISDPFFPKRDRNGFDFAATIGAIKKNEKGELVVVLLDEEGEECGTFRIDNDSIFGIGELIKILGIIEEVFCAADDDFDGKVLCEGESFDYDVEKERYYIKSE